MIRWSLPANSNIFPTFFGWTDAFFVTNGLRKSLAQCDTDVLNRVMVINVQVAVGLDVQINQAVTGNPGCSST